MPARTRNLIGIVLLICLGLLRDLSGILDSTTALNLAREYADHWWLALLLVAVQTGMFTFALAGSFFLWVVAPVYAPIWSTLILTTGATLGGLGAYYFSVQLTDDWIKKLENSRTYCLLRKQDNFFTLFALRTLPAFPHALINYSSGILQVQLSHFILATISGIAIKSYLYASVIYPLSDSASIEALVQPGILLPLLALSTFSLLGMYLNNRRNHPD